MAKSVFSNLDKQGFEYALKLPNITPQECHMIMYWLGYQKNPYGEYSKQMREYAYRRLLDDVDNLGTRVRNGIIAYRKKNLQESNKNIFISESQMRQITESLINEDSVKIKGTFRIDPEKVLLLKKYLDKGFKRGNIETIGDDGYPKNTGIVAMLGDTGNVLRNMTDIQLFYLLQDRFKNIYGDKKKRDTFLKQIIKDWFYDKITKEGLLSVNSF